VARWVRQRSAKDATVWPAHQGRGGKGRRATEAGASGDTSRLAGNLGRGGQEAATEGNMRQGF
jgi:hypothetical protein